MLLLYFFFALLLCAFLAVFFIPVMGYGRKALFERPCTDSWIFGIAAILSPVAAVLFYLKWGASEQLARSYAISRVTTTITNPSSDLHQINQVIQKFLNYLALHPRDAKGWYLLGRLYLDRGNAVKAAEAFKHSFENDLQNTQVMAQYAEALYLVHRQLTSESLLLVQKVLSQDAKNVTVLNLLAMDAFLHHRYALAIIYWQRLRNQYPEDSAEFNTLTQAIEICKKK